MIKTLAVGDLQTNCHILIDEKTSECIIIDPGADYYRIIEELKGLSVGYIVNTHGHGDHIGANSKLKEKYSCQILIHSLDAGMLVSPEENLSSSFYPVGVKSFKADRLLEDGNEIACGKYTLKVLHTPGHTPGGICLLGEGFIFTGDTLFCGSVGRWDLPGGDGNALRNSVNKLSRFPPEIKIYPGHGPACVLKDEIKHNPFLTDPSLYD